MKKISRKNFSGLSHFASKAGIGSSSSTPSASTATASTTPPPPPSAPAPSSNGSIKRPTWADKVRDKLPELGETEYEVLWERGVLGVIFLESEKDGIPYVSKATESCISPLVRAGDVLKYVNVVCSQDHTFSEFFKILATMKKPVLLRFERPASSTTSSDGEDGPLDQRSSSAVGIGAAHATVGLKVLRSNSVPQGESQPKPSRSAFWRTVSAKDPPTQVMAPVVHSNDLPPTLQVQAPGGSSYAPVKLQPPVPTRAGENGDRYRQMDAAATRQYEVSPRDGFSEYAPSPEPEFYEYEVYWETGSLGLYFGEDRTTNLPVVTRATDKANPVVQRMVAPNDTLVSANHVQSRDFTFEAFFARLQQMNKPVRLVFRRKVEPGTMQEPARARTASVTIDSVASPGDVGARRLPTPPRLLPSVEEQESPRHACTPPESPVDARESVRESRRDGTLHSRKPELDIDTSASPPMAPRESPPQVVAASAPSPFAAHRAASSPLNLARASAAIMSTRLEPHRSGSGSLSPDTSRELAGSDARLSDPPMAKRSSQGESPRSGVSTSTSSSPTPRSSQSPPQVSAVGIRSSLPHVASRQSVPTVSIDDDVSPTRSPARSPPSVSAAATTATAAAVSCDVDDLPSDDDDDNSFDTVQQSAMPSWSSGALEAAEVSPPASPKRPAIQNLDDLGMEMKPPAPAHVPAPSSPQSRRRSNSPPKAPLRVSSESRSPWEDAADGIEESDSDDFDSDDSDEESDAPILSRANDSPAQRLSEEQEKKQEQREETRAAVVDDDFALPMETVIDDVVAAEPALDDVAIDVELGIIADVAIGIAIEATIVSEVSEPQSIVAATSDAEPAFAFGATSLLTSSTVPVAAEAIALDDRAGAEVPTALAVEDDEAEQQQASDLQSEFESTARNDLSDDDTDVLDAIEEDIVAEIDGNDLMPQVPKLKSSGAGLSSSSLLSGTSSASGSSLSPFKSNRAVVHANLAKYKRKPKNSRAVTKLPALTEDSALTVPLVAPNAVNTTVQVRGRTKPKPSMLDTPDSTTYLVKWKESRSIGLQLKEVRLAKGVFPLVTDVCQEPCCELLKHVCVGDVIVEINGRNTSLMGVKKTVSFLKTCSKTTLLKLRHGPGFVPQRVSAYV